MRGHAGVLVRRQRGSMGLCVWSVCEGPGSVIWGGGCAGVARLLEQFKRVPGAEVTYCSLKVQ